MMTRRRRRRRRRKSKLMGVIRIWGVNTVL